MRKRTKSQINEEPKKKEEEESDSEEDTLSSMFKSSDLFENSGKYTKILTESLNIKLSQEFDNFENLFGDNPF
jgi:hypothetical protein